MLESILIHKLRNSEFVQFFNVIVRIIKTKDPEKLQNLEICNQIEEKTALASSMYKTKRGSDITPQLEKADERRDNAIGGFNLVLEGLTLHYDNAVRTSAEFLLNKIRIFGGGIGRMNYQSETSTLASIVRKLTGTTEAVEALEKTGLTDWLAELDAANKEFENLHFARLNANAESPDVKFEEVRKELIELYRFLTNYLEMSAKISSDTVFEKTIDAINELAEEYNQLILVRTNDDDNEEEVNDAENSIENN
ncbi:DUF6261 family protein [Marinilabilia rubra]|uniref:Uncharacterized protein n=1 Tax=Marinilabilia rubra TaxID=2162893 RepID=A0A2U2B6Q8_9BACT|nr:DUF6261 family protein [Marinilabilia rubra]PWD98723.1 hypothetical protein DDZ16_13360 [Marinilabilia rubra]